MTFRNKLSRLAGKQTLLPQFASMPLAIALAVALSGCGDSIHAPASTASGPQLYMTPAIYGGPDNATSTLATFSIDHAASSFVQQTYAFSAVQSGAQIDYSGDLASPGLNRGLQELELTYACGAAATAGAGCPGIAYNPPQANSGWTVELADRSGGLVQLTGHPFAPMVPAIACPSMKSAETFLFVTLPARLIATDTGHDDWNPQLETAYGSVDIGVAGSTVTFANIKQSLFGGGAQAASASATGACSSTVYGNTVAVPANPTITTDPTGTITVSPQATIGISPSGMLVEDNNSENVQAPTGTFYENVLGAGTGAIGLPKPSTAVDPKALAGAQYLGFFYGAGSHQNGNSYNGFSSVASFGFPSPPSTCLSVAPPTPTMLYGGDFAGNNPASAAVQSNGGFPISCNFAIDLGAQDQSTNGLFPLAKVYVGSGFSTNKTGAGYGFPAVAIAGQLNGKYAIFVIGVDTIGSPNQAWGIYLLQSN